MRAAVGAFGARDVRRGFASGRFNVPDLRMSTSFMFGAYVNSLLACLDLDEPEPALNQVVEMMLRVLGLSASEAQTIANAPLPPLESH
jgi:hypothetical protein